MHERDGDEREVRAPSHWSGTCACSSARRLQPDEALSRWSRASVQLTTL